MDKGGYGCIFTPALSCRYKKKQEEVESKKDLVISKLTLSEYAKKEDDVSSLIRKIPLWKNYFIVSETMCQPSSSQTDNDLADCPVLKDKNGKLSNFRLLFMPYGGQPLTIYRFPISEFDIVEFATHLIAGGAILNLFGIVHRDIHNGNVLVDKDNIPRIIDFNLAIFVEQNLTQVSLSHQHTYNLNQEPPDSTLVNAIHLGYSADVVLFSIFHKKHILNKISSVLDIPMKDMKEEFEKFYLQSKSVKEGDDKKWFETYWRTIDSWAIGVILVELIYKLSMWSDFSTQLDSIQNTLIPVLRGMCSVNPLRRLDCVQALNMLDPKHFIIRKYATAWLQKVG